MIQNLHTHSAFDDGRNTLEEMIAAAKGAQLAAIGLSGHSPLPFQNNWAIAPEQFEWYRAQAYELKHKYVGILPVYVGLEYDALSAPPRTAFDYLIGSVHHLVVNGRIYSVDCSPADTQTCIDEAFAGNAHAMEEAFYAQYDTLADNPAIDIVGHFDLITKFDESRTLFRAAPDCARTAMEHLVRRDKFFEVNTGAVCRGYRNTPYPSAQLLQYLRKLGGRIVLTTDAHRTQDLTFGMEDAAALARACGFREHWLLGDNGFFSCPL